MKRTRLVGLALSVITLVGAAGRPLAASQCDVLVGTWHVEVVGLEGKMELRRSGSGWAGRLHLDGNWEDLGGVRCAPTDGVLSFDRPGVGQHWTGTLTASRMSGEFTWDGGSAPWSARRVGDAAPAPKGAPAAGPAPRVAATDLGDGLTGYTVSSLDQGPVEALMRGHRFCALSLVLSGGFNSSCEVRKRGRDWVLIATDPPEDGGRQTQSCGAICQ